MQWHTTLTDNGFQNCSWAHVVKSITEVCQVLMQCRLMDQSHTGTECWFYLYSLQAEISQYSLNLLMIAGWTAAGLVCSREGSQHWEWWGRRRCQGFWQTVAWKVLHLVMGWVWWVLCLKAGIEVVESIGRKVSLGHCAFLVLYCVAFNALPHALRVVGAEVT